MNVAELKMCMVEMITTVEEKSEAEALLRIIAEFLSQYPEMDDFESRMTPEQIADLEASVAESEDEANLVSHEDAMKQLSRWLKR